MAASRNTASAYVLSLLRIVIAFTFFLHGAQKFFGMFGGMGGHGARAAFLTLFWCAGLVETVGGFLMFVGLFTRPVAFILCGEMAVAYFRQHAPHSLWPIQNGGELAVLYCFMFLYFFAAGPGPISVDRAFRNRRF